MKPTERPVQAMASLEEQLLQLLVRQTRRVPILNFLASLMIAALAYGRVPTIVLAAWLALVAAVLIGRRLVLSRLASFQGASVQTKLRIVTILSLIHGSAQGLSLGFFPFL